MDARTLLAAALLFAPVACSVKENRSECPVYVTVLTDRFLQQGLHEGVISFAAAQPLHREKVGFLSCVREGLMLRFPPAELPIASME